MQAGRAAMRGFTLVELMVALVVAAILLAVAVPAFDNFVVSSRLRTVANSLSASVQLAKSEAMKRNAAVTLCKSANGTSCVTSGGWEQGWIVLSGSTVLRRQQALPSGYQVSSSTNALSFRPSGMGSTQATLTACRASPLGREERVVTVSATGRAMVEKTTVGSCS
ncbi:GspH/FimT family pseudopilin [Pseudomonas sp. L-22-4S-12]|uniref:GspH/FimT family pseudopilin n=1 Tax=Pseudomonas sp. L-22-4S-12 TaxID=2610893 RepID=UPI001C49B875|nr:GspH/FimT family pseudopilin [Pseudomonas sp. L-22-4S-12]